MNLRAAMVAFNIAQGFSTNFICCFPYQKNLSWFFFVSFILRSPSHKLNGKTILSGLNPDLWWFMVKVNSDTCLTTRNHHRAPMILLSSWGIKVYTPHTNKKGLKEVFIWYISFMLYLFLNYHSIALARLYISVCSSAIRILEYLLVFQRPSNCRACFSFSARKITSKTRVSFQWYYFIRYPIWATDSGKVHNFCLSNTLSVRQPLEMTGSSSRNSFNLDNQLNCLSLILGCGEWSKVVREKNVIYKKMHCDRKPKCSIVKIRRAEITVVVQKKCGEPSAFWLVWIKTMKRLKSEF